MKTRIKKEMIKAVLFILVNWIAIGNPLNTFAQGQPVTTYSELQRLYSIAKLPAYIDGSEVHQVSSYDRKGGNNDGFEGTYSYLRKNDDGSLAIFEAEGKGVIERIWTPTPTDDTLDFYFDGSATPSYSIKFNDLFSGKIFPFVTPVVGRKVGGFYSYLPIPYEKGCKIVYRGSKILFHQIQYRKYKDNYAVQTFSPAFSAKEKTMLQDILNLWNKPVVSINDIYPNKQQSVKVENSLQPGQSIILAQLNSGGRITGIEIESTDAFAGLNNLIDIKVTWDNEQNAAIYAPAADFFGFAFGQKSMQSLLMGVDSNNKAYCFIPMPFDKGAKVELVYRNTPGVKKSVKIKSSIYYNNTKRNSATEGKFYANWKREEPAVGEPFVFLQGKGKGHYVGTLLQSQGKTYTHFTEFFEGDDSTVIDGVNSIHGTGSEDYFNGGWYAQPGGWVERLGTTLHGCLDYSLPYSRTGGYRFYITDKLPFNQSIYHSIEHGPEGNNRKVDYISVAMYYATKPVENTSIPTNATSKVFIPDTLTFYTGLMKHLTYDGKMNHVNGKALLNPQEEGGMNVNVNELAPGSYEIYLNVSSGKPVGSEVLVQTPGESAGKWTIIAENKDNTSSYYIGEVLIRNPEQPIRILFKSKNNKVAFHQVMFIKKDNSGK